MKMITNFKNLDMELETELNVQLNDSVTYPDMNLNNDSGEALTPRQLISCVHAQFEMLYKTNYKRKFLLKEISSYIIRK